MKPAPAVVLLREHPENLPVASGIYGSRSTQAVWNLRRSTASPWNEGRRARGYERTRPNFHLSRLKAFWGGSLPANGGRKREYL